MLCGADEAGIREAVSKLRMILTELISSINLAFSRSKKLSFGVVSSYTAIECRASDMAKLPSYHGADQEGRRSWT